MAYDGTGFHGWQVQPHLRTLQGTLAAAIARLTGEQVLPQGSGRTDRGVHALGQVASFTLKAHIPPINLKRALNRALPGSIRILQAEHAPADFHARHSAQSKTYEYRIFDHYAGPGEEDIVCPPTLAPFVWDCPFRLDVELARQAAAAIIGEHDFSSFAAVDPDQTQRRAAELRSSVRTVLESSWSCREGLLVYRVTGTGFLHHMVRNLVGTFVDIARGRLASGSIEQILAAQDRTQAGPTAAAGGLFLMQVDYSSDPADRAAGQPGEGGHGQTVSR